MKIKTITTGILLSSPKEIEKIRQVSEFNQQALFQVAVIVLFHCHIGILMINSVPFSGVEIQCNSPPCSLTII